jgi:hypothetical protein
MQPTTSHTQSTSLTDSFKNGAVKGAYLASIPALTFWIKAHADPAIERISRAAEFGPMRPLLNGDCQTDFFKNHTDCINPSSFDEYYNILTSTSKIHLVTSGTIGIGALVGGIIGVAQYLWNY